MSYSPDDWVELVRAVDGVQVGQRGKVTGTGFLGEVDIQLTTGARLVGLDASAVEAARSGTAFGDTGCVVASLVSLAPIIAAVVTTWSRARWGA
jgi:hypothetical protein